MDRLHSTDDIQRIVRKSINVTFREDRLRDMSSKHRIDKNALTVIVNQSETKHFLVLSRHTDAPDVSAFTVQLCKSPNLR